MQSLEMNEPAEGAQGKNLTDTAITAMMGKRRKFVVHRGFQFRMAFFNVLTLSVVVTLLVLLNLTFASNSHRATESLVTQMPQLDAGLRQMDRLTIAMMVAISVLVAASVFVLGLLRSHRIAGAAFNLQRCLDRVAQGRYETRVVLRRRDDLQELRAAFNRMSERLGDDARQELERLEALLDRVRSDAFADSAEAIDVGLTELIRRKRDQLEA